MATDRITDPILGDGEILFGRGEGAWATFELEFAPTNSRVLVTASVVDDRVPQHQRDLYLEVEAWYPNGHREVFESVRREVEKDEVLRKWLPPGQIPELLQLIGIDVRYPFRRPGKCVLRYRFDRNYPDWIVTIDENYHVEWSGLAD